MGHRKENTNWELWLQVEEHFLSCCLCGQGKIYCVMLFNLASHWQTHLKGSSLEILREQYREKPLLFSRQRE